MTDEEFDLLDELYFVTKFETLKIRLTWNDETLLKVLASLLQKNWIKCLDSQDQTLHIKPEDLPALIDVCFFLATKEGLQMHNQR